jgi:hypothetical protein
MRWDWRGVLTRPCCLLACLSRCQAISWHLLELLKPSVPTRRVVFHEITPSAVRAGLDAPRYPTLPKTYPYVEQYLLN